MPPRVRALARYTGGRHGLLQPPARLSRRRGAHAVEHPRAAKAGLSHKSTELSWPHSLPTVTQEILDRTSVHSAGGGSPPESTLSPGLPGKDLRLGSGPVAWEAVPELCSP